MIRLATPEDHSEILRMSKGFIKTTQYKDIYTEEALSAFILDILNKPISEAVAFLKEGEGMLVGGKSKFVYGNIYLATEYGFWVEPEHRGLAVGKDLKDAFEYWARQTGCSRVVMISLDKAVGKFYEKDGYKLCEHLYMKEI